MNALLYAQVFCLVENFGRERSSVCTNFGCGREVGTTQWTMSRERSSLCTNFCLVKNVGCGW